MKITGILVNNQNHNDTLVVTNTKVFNLGRLPKPTEKARGYVPTRHNDLNVKGDGMVSKEHCFIEAFRGEAWVHDLSSRNGTWVNGVNVVREDGINYARLDDLASLTIGNTSYTYYQTFWGGEQIPDPAYDNTVLERLMR